MRSKDKQPAVDTRTAGWTWTCFTS